ncbi:MAG: hypothetical protein ACLQBY_01475 [Solirubrobacteraceae bacterium]
MKRIKFLGLCLMAAFATSAVATATASATQLHPYVAGETYIGSEGLGSGYEAKELAANGAVDSYIVKYPQKPHGYAWAIPAGNIYKGFEIDKQPCTSAGAEIGVVKTEPLTAEFGWINKAKGEVGLLERPTHEGGLIAEFTCGENVVEFRGGVIGPITPINKKVYAGEQLTHNLTPVEGKQAVTKFEGGPTTELELQVNGRGFEPAAIEDLGKLTVFTTVEITTTSGAPEFADSKGKKVEFKPFGQCPVGSPGVEACVLLTSDKGSEFTVGSTTVPLAKSITLQGGLEGPAFVAAANGDTLSPEPQTVPGGLQTVIQPSLLPKKMLVVYNKDKHKKVTATIELAGPAGSIALNRENLVDEEGTALGLPVKVRLEGPLLGATCYIGSEATPVVVDLTTGTSSPPEPNKPIKGKVGKLESSAEGTILTITDDSLVNNAFAVPGVEGCGTPESIDEAVDARTGLPSAAGANSAIIDDTLKLTSAEAVKEALQ